MDRFSVGPWEVDGSVVRDSAGWAVAFVPTDDGIGEANAALIAASPRLLSYARALMRERTKRRHENGCICSECEDLHEIETVLAKATGGPLPVPFGKERGR